jgi:hypothetical protein
MSLAPPSFSPVSKFRDFSPDGEFLCESAICPRCAALFSDLLRSNQPLSLFCTAFEGLKLDLRCTAAWLNELLEEIPPDLFQSRAHDALSKLNATKRVVAIVGHKALALLDTVEKRKPDSDVEALFRKTVDSLDDAIKATKASEAAIHLIKDDDQIPGIQEAQEALCSVRKTLKGVAKEIDQAILAGDTSPDRILRVAMGAIGSMAFFCLANDD